MATNFKAGRYNLTDYDRNLCLKSPLLLLIAMLYLSRAMVVIVIGRLTALVGASTDFEALIAGMINPLTLISSLVAFTVLMAYCRRVPGGSRAMRGIWARGQWILAAAALLDFGLLLAGSPLWHGGSAPHPELGLLAMAMDLYFAVYLIASRRVRDVFSAFPSPEAEQTQPAEQQR